MTRVPLRKGRHLGKQPQKPLAGGLSLCAGALLLCCLAAVAGGAYTPLQASPASSHAATGEPLAPSLALSGFAGTLQPLRPASSQASSAVEATSRRSLLVEAPLAPAVTATYTVSSLPPPPAPPPALSFSAGYTVSSSATLGGLSAAMFGPAAQTGFSSAMATSLKVGSDAVAVTGVTDVARRHLLGFGAAVAFTVSVSSASAASGVASGITAVAADSSAFVAALNSNLVAAGLPVCSGVSVSPPVVSAPPALNLSSVDVSAAVSAVATSFTNLSASAAAEKQTELLSSLSAGTANVSFSKEGASAAASLVLAVVSAAPGVVLSVESQSAALNVLAAVSNAKIDATSGVGQTIASALDSVASSAVSGGNPAALAAVQGVINNLAAGQAASLLENMDMTPGAPPPAPATTSTPSIQTLVQVDPPGSNRLTTQPLTAPGSASSFAPMPEGLLPTTTPLVTQFFSLKFDPNGGSTAGGALSNSGVTRLAFTNPDGSPIPVTNATSPILFALPRVSLDPESQAVCTYWDPLSKTYQTNGCIGVPNPQPPNHMLAFIPGYETPDDTSLANAWNISGPMVDGLCKTMVIDCNSDAPCTGTVVGRSCKVYPDPRNPLAVPAVSCPAVGNMSNSSAANAPTPLQPVLRVFYGQFCPLWQDNDYNCSWDNIKQSFNGGGCVSAGDSTQCMCRHLTDFAAARKPKVAVCSTTDLMSLNPGDVVTRLQWIFIIVVSLFGLVRLQALC